MTATTGTRNRKRSTPAALTELALTGTRTEITALIRAARASGRYVHHTPPQPMPGADPRIRVRLWLHSTT